MFNWPPTPEEWSAFWNACSFFAVVWGILVARRAYNVWKHELRATTDHQLAMDILQECRTFPEYLHRVAGVASTIEFQLTYDRPSPRTRKLASEVVPFYHSMQQLVNLAGHADDMWGTNHLTWVREVQTKVVDAISNLDFYEWALHEGGAYCKDMNENSAAEITSDVRRIIDSFDDPLAYDLSSLADSAAEHLTSARN